MEKKIQLKVDNVMVSDNQATMTIVLTTEDPTVDSVELTGLLFSMMFSVKRIHQETTSSMEPLSLDQAEAIVIRKLRLALKAIAPEEEVKEEVPQTTHNKSYRKWTPEQIQRAQEKRKATMLKKSLEAKHGNPLLNKD